MTFDMDKISHIAQTVSFAFEDHYHDLNKRKQFQAIFDRYLSPVDPNGEMETYDAIIQLGRKVPEEFEMMLKELRDRALISG